MTDDKLKEWHKTAEGRDVVPHGIQGFLHTVIKGCLAGDTLEEFCRNYKYYMYDMEVAVRCARLFFGKGTKSSLWMLSVDSLSYRRLVVYHQTKHIKPFFALVSFKSDFLN